MAFDIIIDWEQYATQFKGNKVTMELRPLKSWASVLLTPIYLETAKKQKENKKQKEMSEDEINFAFKIQEIAKKILPDHVRNLEGISVNKLAITNEMLCEETVFAPLVMDIIAELSNRSQITKEDKKK